MLLSLTMSSVAHSRADRIGIKVEGRGKLGHQPGVMSDSPHEVQPADVMEAVEGSSECLQCRSVTRTTIKDRTYRWKRRHLMALRIQMFSFEAPPMLTVFKRVILPAETSDDDTASIVAESVVVSTMTEQVNSCHKST